MTEMGEVPAPHGTRGYRAAGQRRVEGELTRKRAVGRDLLRKAFRDLAAALMT